jgi:hypothetical protein
MARSCEVCGQAEAIGARGGRLRRIIVQERIVALCDEHAAEYRLSSTKTVEELRSLFVEPGGRRSRLGRRAALDRRVFPPRPEGRRRGDGRRDSDPQD